MNYLGTRPSRSFCANIFAFFSTRQTVLEKCDNTRAISPSPYPNHLSISLNVTSFNNIVVDKQNLSHTVGPARSFRIPLW